MSEKVNTDNQFYEEILQPISVAIKDENPEGIREALQDQHPSDVAEVLNNTEEADREVIIASIEELDSQVFSYLDKEVKDHVTSVIGSEESAAAIDELESDEAVQFVEDLEDERRDEILDQLSDEKRIEVEESLSYPEDSAARIANKNFVTVSEDKTIGAIIDHMRQKEDLPKDFYTVFVLDGLGKPTHFTPISRVIRNERDVEVSEIMETVKHTISVDVDQEEAAKMFKKYSLISLPVVDEVGKMIGVITADDISHIIDEEVWEDMFQMAGLKNSYNVTVDPIKKALDRSPWLLVNMFTSILTAFVISQFEGSIEKLVALATLMPIVASMSGNAGSQTLTITVRSISAGDLNSANYINVLRKELIAALINAVLIGTIVFFISYLLYANFLLSLIMLTSIVLTFALGSVSGYVIPIAIQKLNYDPAVASATFVFAVTDISSFFIFLGMATMFLI